ncbi:MAG: TRAP transporter small permease subunit [Chloroflexi bacterium]|nr:TRAP transporter small permease subunit [Chloroflexota bacterium]
MRVLQKFYEKVGLISDWSGKGVSILVPALILSVVIEVFARYALNSPTIWSYTVSYMMGTVIIALGMCYVYYHHANVRVDIFYTRLSRKWQLVIDTSLTAFLFFPLVFMLTKVWAQDTWHSYLCGDVPTQGIWYPPLWPFKALITIGFALLLLQGFAMFLKDVASLSKGGEEPW